MESRFFPKCCECEKCVRQVTQPLDQTGNRWAQVIPRPLVGRLFPGVKQRANQWADAPIEDLYQ